MNTATNYTVIVRKGCARPVYKQSTESINGIPQHIRDGVRNISDNGYAVVIAFQFTENETSLRNLAFTVDKAQELTGGQIEALIAEKRAQYEASEAVRIAERAAYMEAIHAYSIFREAGVMVGINAHHAKQSQPNKYKETIGRLGRIVHHKEGAVSFMVALAEDLTAAGGNFQANRDRIHKSHQMIASEEGWDKDQFLSGFFEGYNSVGGE